MKNNLLRSATGAWLLSLALASGAHAATVYAGDLIQGTRVVQVLFDSPDTKCDGDGCPAEGTDYVE